MTQHIHFQHPEFKKPHARCGRAGILVTKVSLEFDEVTCANCRQLVFGRKKPPGQQIDGQPRS